MSNSLRFSSRAWLVIPLLAFGFVAWTNSVRLQRAKYTTGLVAEPLKVDAISPTGFEAGARELIVPEHNNDSYHWIAQTQQMFSRGEWRVRHVDYDNAPFGRTVDSPSPYRWWLGAVAWVDHALSGRPLGASVERAALFADPLLQLLFLTGTTIFVAWQFSFFSAALFSAGVAGLFPLGAAFIPGAPDDRGLSLICAVWSVLPLLVGLRVMGHAESADQADPTHAIRRAWRWFFLAGVAGGLGAWVSVASQVPINMGIVVGGLIVSRTLRKNVPLASKMQNGGSVARTWALSGAATILIACVIDYFPTYLASWQLRVLHPLYGLAWLGLGALLVQTITWFQARKNFWNFRNAIMLGFGIAAVVALPVVMWKIKNQGFLATEVSAYRLTKLPGGVVATTLWAWLLRDGVTMKTWTTILPVLLILPAGWLIWRRATNALTRSFVALALGPVLIAIGFACRHLGWWSTVDALSLILLVAMTDSKNAPTQAASIRWAWSGVIAVIVGLGAFQLIPSAATGSKVILTESEVIGLIERDLARWLAKHAGTESALVLAPPNETIAFYYYGGLRGVGTLAWENQEGIRAAVRIVSASTWEEARELISRRGITHIVIPSWDSSLDEYARIGAGRIQDTFLSRLHAWALPVWLKPVAYVLPTLAGFEGQSVKIFEVVDDQGEAQALSRTAEYFIEMGQLDLAASAAQTLRRFPADFGALVARAQVEIARNDTEGFGQSVDLLRQRLSARGDRNLPWDRRVSLAVVLARAKQTDLARTQVQRCLTEIDEAKLRSLSTGSLYRLQVLGKAYGLTIADSHLRELSRDLLPDELRSRL